MKGNKINIGLGDKAHTFTAGGRKRLDLGEGMVIVNGVVRFANGQEHYAVLEIDESSSGEHWGTGIFIPSDKHACDMTWQDDDDFFQRLGLTQEEVYPYTYKYTGNVKCNDHHIGDDGWSF